VSLLTLPVGYVMSDWLATHAGIATAEAGMVREPLCLEDAMLNNIGHLFNSIANLSLGYGKQEKLPRSQVSCMTRRLT
jgi:hypothetical protein